MLYACFKSWFKKSIFIMLPAISCMAGTAYGWFNFTDPDPVTVDWKNENIEQEMTFKLRSCFGLGSLSCNWVNTPQVYYLSATNFNLSYQGSRGEDLKTRVIAEAIFEQGTQREDLIGGQKMFDPGISDRVDAKMTFKVYNSELYDALPGIYQATVKLQGGENDGFIGDQDTTEFELKINIPERLKISGLEAISPISLNSDGTTEVSSGWKQFCVFSQGGSEFQLRAYGHNDPSRFILLQNENIPEIPYSLVMKSSEGEEKPITPNANEGSSPYRWKGSTNPDCADGKYMYLQVNVDKTSAAAGVYSDVVTIVVEPPVN
ncbi:hypothetical protein [Endozoicomonas elysicola]|uniref:Spore coat protein U domain-containing protein n=1 Tax=Endozoicomonas elysicola TaxID=305900 RepID=A0A081K7E2_9GAMM|nr:hypothetical protein [Endozoicomonas elysicola]KEI70068.1 hypothetical protein GV64_04300 [Endozoicomonas elysicola]